MKQNIKHYVQTIGTKTRIAPGRIRYWLLVNSGNKSSSRIPITTADDNDEDDNRLGKISWEVMGLSVEPTNGVSFVILQFKTSLVTN